MCLGDLFVGWISLRFLLVLVFFFHAYICTISRELGRLVFMLVFMSEQLKTLSCLI
jgi:hypothetical protein